MWQPAGSEHERGGDTAMKSTCRREREREINREVNRELRNAGGMERGGKGV